MKLGALVGLPLPAGFRPEIYLDGVGWETVDQIDGVIVVHVGSARYHLPADREVQVRGGGQLVRARALDDQHCGGRWEYSLEGSDWRVLRELDHDGKKVGLVDTELCADWVNASDSVWMRPIIPGA